jgi:hypothetical protein
MKIRYTTQRDITSLAVAYANHRRTEQTRDHPAPQLTGYNIGIDAARLLAEPRHGRFIGAASYNCRPTTSGRSRTPASKIQIRGGRYIARRP